MMKMKNANDSFPTSDFTLATFLYSKGIILRGIMPDPKDFKRMVFLFNKPPDELLSQFQSGEANTSVLAFENAQNTLRGMLR